MSNAINDKLYESLFEEVSDEADEYDWEDQSLEDKELWIIKEVRKRMWGKYD